MFTNPLKLSHTRCRSRLLILTLIMHELATMTSLPGNNSLESVGRWRHHLAVDTPVRRSKTIAGEAWTCQCTPAVYTPLQHQTTASRAMGARRILSRGGGNEGVWRTEFPQQGPGAATRWKPGSQAPRNWRHCLNIYFVYWGSRQHLQQKHFSTFPGGGADSSPLPVPAGAHEQRKHVYGSSAVVRCQSVHTYFAWLYL